MPSVYKGTTLKHFYESVFSETYFSIIFPLPSEVIMLSLFCCYIILITVKWCSRKKIKNISLEYNVAFVLKKKKEKHTTSACYTLSQRYKANIMQHSTFIIRCCTYVLGTCTPTMYVCGYLISLWKYVKPYTHRQKTHTQNAGPPSSLSSWMVRRVSGEVQFNEFT